MALVEAARFYDSLEAGLAKSRLADDGIESILFDFNSSMEGPSFLIPIRLMVIEEELAETLEILAAQSR